MSIISFWTEDTKETGQTSVAIAVATQMAIQHNKKILLIDDIYTTGSTANECCKILQEAKPKKIDVFTIAKD